MAFKASSSRAPASPSVYKVEANKLYGIDSTTSDDNVALGRACGVSYFDVEQNGGDPAPGICNFIRTNHGEIGKRRGAKYVDIPWKTTARYIFDVKSLEKITVICTIDVAGENDFHPAVHFLSFEAGAYTDNVLWLFSYDGGNYTFDVFDSVIVNEEKCVFFFNGAFVFVKTNDISSAVYINGIQLYKASYSDSLGVYMFSGDGVPTYQEFNDAGIYTPITFIGNVPSGGSGTAYEPINLLSPWVCEQYRGDGATDEYVLMITPDVGHEPIAFVKDSSGEWTSASAAWSGANVKFTTAPEKTSVSGEDNVKIYYRRANRNNPLSECKIYCNFGVGGYKDRLWLSGNENYPNYVWYSQEDNYGYISELSYMTFADNNCIVKALAGQDTSLAVITNDKCYLVSGVENNSEGEYVYDPSALFIISHVFESAPPAGYPRPLVFNNEIVYMSAFGLAAIAPSNVMDERYAQIRSERINEWLLKENLEELCCCVCGDFFVISNRAGRIYLLDGAQFSSAESKPFSYRQYEGYIWELQADFVWEFAGCLFFAQNTKICCVSFEESGERNDYTDFYKDVSEIGENDYKTYNVPIKCYWETPNVYGSDFYNRKSFSKLGVLLKKTMSPDDRLEINTAVRIWAKKNNDPWKLVKDYDGDQSIFRYDYLNYGIFSYRSAGKRYAVEKKIKFKKTYSLKLRFENDIEGMPLYLQAFGLEYSR